MNLSSILSVITGFFGGDFLSMKTLVLILIGMLIGWHVPMPTWAKTFWAWIGKKFPAVDTVTNEVVTEVETVVADVANVMNVVKDVEKIVTPSSNTTTTPVAPAADVTTPVAPAVDTSTASVAPVVSADTTTTPAQTTPPASN